MIIKKNKSVLHENSPACKVWEYQFPSKLFSFATAFIEGRYPEKGRVANLECEETYYVISGSGTVHSEKGDFILEEGDVYFFEKEEKYWVEGNNFYLALVNAQPFDPNQHKEFD